MILLALRDYLQQRGQANLRDLALHFEAEPEAMRAMLGHLIRKGQVCRMATHGNKCGDCAQCDPLTLEVYAWESATIAAASSRNSSTQYLRPGDIGCAR